MPISAALTMLVRHGWAAVTRVWCPIRLLLRLFATALDEAPLLVLLVLIALLVATR